MADRVTRKSVSITSSRCALPKAELNRLYRRYNRREYVHPDPLEFLYAYPDTRDREIVGLIASCLAYGRVAQILKSVEYVLGKKGSSPAGFIAAASDRDLRRAFAGFKHRFTTDNDLVALLSGMRGVIEKHGSLNACFTAAIAPDDETILPAMTAFVDALGAGGRHLLPSPLGGSACKRLNLYLRWMVRSDAVDPGGWSGVSPSQLIIPLDTHMACIARGLGITRRKSANMKMAVEVTDAFRAVSRDDPVKYDFALTRFGIRTGMSTDDVIERLKAKMEAHQDHG